MKLLYEAIIKGQKSFYNSFIMAEEFFQRDHLKAEPDRR